MQVWGFYALELTVVVTHTGNQIATKHGLSFLDKHVLNMNIERYQGFSVLVSAVINHDGRSRAAVSESFGHPAVGDGDDRLAGETPDIDTLVDRAIHPPDIEISDDLGSTRRIDHFPPGTIDMFLQPQDHLSFGTGITLRSITAIVME